MNQDEMLHTARSAAGAGGFFDVACPTTDRLSSWIKEGLLQAWDEKSIHFDQIEGRFAADAHTVRNGKRMGSPNLWGSAALGYMCDSVAIDPQRASLMDLFD
jgi:spermidine/putrescine-binding protein